MTSNKSLISQAYLDKYQCCYSTNAVEQMINVIVLKNMLSYKEKINWKCKALEEIYNKNYSLPATRMLMYSLSEFLQAKHCQKC